MMARTNIIGFWPAFLYLITIISIKLFFQKDFSVFFSKAPCKHLKPGVLNQSGQESRLSGPFAFYPVFETGE